MWSQTCGKMAVIVRKNTSKIQFLKFGLQEVYFGCYAICDKIYTTFGGFLGKKTSSPSGFLSPHFENSFP